jgi:hypothetical protein
MSQYPKKGGVFSKFANLEYFKTFHVDNGVLSWGEGEIDIAPETLYHKATGEPFPIKHDLRTLRAVVKKKEPVCSSVSYSKNLNNISALLDNRSDTSCHWSICSILKK